MKSAKATSDAAIKTAEAATVAAANTGSSGGQSGRRNCQSRSSSYNEAAITSAAGGSDIHGCTTLLPIPPHGPGIVITPSATVMIAASPPPDGMRSGAVGPPNKISMGCATVLIGG